MSGTDQFYTLVFDDWDLDAQGGMLQLYVAATGQLIDAVAWGDANGASAPSAPLVTGFGSAAAAPSGAETNTLGRKSDASSGDNAADFCEQAGTLGANNGSCI